MNKYIVRTLITGHYRGEICLEDAPYDSYWTCWDQVLLWSDARMDHHLSRFLVLWERSWCWFADKSCKRKRPETKIRRRTLWGNFCRHDHLASLAYWCRFILKPIKNHWGWGKGSTQCWKAEHSLCKFSRFTLRVTCIEILNAKEALV